MIKKNKVRKLPPLQKIEYSFKGKIWKYKGPASWHFVTLPKPLSKKIRKVHQVSEEGWGRLKVFAKINNTNWSTAIWFDTKIGSFIIPLKAKIRKSESLAEGQAVKIELFIDFDQKLSDAYPLRF